jgi:hypothetical protein
MKARQKWDLLILNCKGYERLLVLKLRDFHIFKILKVIWKWQKMFKKLFFSLI